MVKLHVQLNRNPDGTKYAAIGRGYQWWARINLEEIPTLCNQMMDIYESEQK